MSISSKFIVVARDIDGVHVASLVVEIVRLGVPEIKAALLVQKRGTHHKEALGLTLDGNAYVGVVA